MVVVRLKVVSPGVVVVGLGVVVAGMVVVGSGMLVGAGVVVSQMQSENTASCGTGTSARKQLAKNVSSRSSPPMMSLPLWRQLRGQTLTRPKVEASRRSIIDPKISAGDRA